MNYPHLCEPLTSLFRNPAVAYSGFGVNLHGPAKAGRNSTKGISAAANRPQSATGSHARPELTRQAGRRVRHTYPFAHAGLPLPHVERRCVTLSLHTPPKKCKGFAEFARQKGGP